MQLEIGNTVSVSHKGSARNGIIIDIDFELKLAKVKWVERKPREWNQWFNFEDITFIHA